MKPIDECSIEELETELKESGHEVTENLNPEVGEGPFILFGPEAMVFTCGLSDANDLTKEDAVKRAVKFLRKLYKTV